MENHPTLSRRPQTSYREFKLPEEKEIERYHFINIVFKDAVKKREQFNLGQTGQAFETRSLDSPPISYEENSISLKSTKSNFSIKSFPFEEKRKQIFEQYSKKSPKPVEKEVVAKKYPKKKKKPSFSRKADKVGPSSISGESSNDQLEQFPESLEAILQTLTSKEKSIVKETSRVVQIPENDALKGVKLIDLLNLTNTREILKARRLWRRSSNTERAMFSKAFLENL
ncbi:hypothetical protein ROZALSC1DRAFT_20868 [Rozella allomycis CSF55]|nr:hypothetical protein ROZALSC1DRAFT_20868 [Rozella allomycis CSF55]